MVEEKIGSNVTSNVISVLGEETTGFNPQANSITVLHRNKNQAVVTAAASVL